MIRVGQPYEDDREGGYAICYRDHDLVATLRFKTKAEAVAAFANLFQGHRRGLFTVRWSTHQRKAICDCGWSSPRVPRKEEWLIWAAEHETAMLTEELGIAKEYLRSA